MKVVRPAGIGGPIFVLPDVGRAALAGPFTTGAAARLWIIEQVERGFSEERRVIWGTLVAKLGGVSHDLGLELFLVGQIARGKSLQELLRYIARPVERRDPKALAAGEAA